MSCDNIFVRLWPPACLNTVKTTVIMLCHVKRYYFTVFLRTSKFPCRSLLVFGRLLQQKYQICCTYVTVTRLKFLSKSHLTARLQKCRKTTTNYWKQVSKMICIVEKKWKSSVIVTQCSAVHGESCLWIYQISFLNCWLLKVIKLIPSKLCWRNACLIGTWQNFPSQLSLSDYLIQLRYVYSGVVAYVVINTHMYVTRHVRTFTQT